MNRASILGLALLLATLSVPLVAAPAAAQGPPSAAIVYPLNGAVLSTVGTRLQVDVEDFVLTPDATPLCVDPTRGRIRVYLNDTPVMDTADENASLRDLSIDLVKIGVQLVCTNGSPLSPAVWSNVTVTAAEPAITIQRPGDPIRVSTLGGRIEYTVRNFNLAPGWVGGPNAPGEGHVHLYVNGTTLVGLSGTTSADVASFPEGAFTLEAELHENDHSLVTTTARPAGFNDTVNAIGVPPSIRIVTPSDNSAASTGGARIIVEVAGFELDEENYAGSNIPGRGHIHYFLNGTLMGAVASTVFEFGSLPEGTHTLAAELRNNDHSPLTPAVSDSVRVTVTGPSLAIVEPTGTDLSTLGARIVVEVGGLELSAENYAGENVAGQGHIHYSLDGALVAATAETSHDFASLPSGAHTIRAELRNNDHSALSPAVFDEIAVTVTVPSISIGRPEVTTVSTLGFQMHVAVAGIDLDQENYGAANVPGHGHIHYYVDGVLAGAVTTTMFNFGAISAGLHTVRAELRNNDHGALSPAVFDEMVVTAGVPAIAITAPDGTTVSTLGFRIEVSVSGFILDEANYAGANVAGQGHIHYLVDGVLMAATTTTSFSFDGLTAGAHTVRAELRNNDHGALSPAVFDEIAVTGAAPGLAIDEPAGTAVTVSTLIPFGIRVNVQNFVLDSDAVGGANEAGRGHIHYYVNTTLVGVSVSTWFNFGTLGPGTHAIRAELRNNDHSALATVVSDTITVTAVAPSIAASAGATSIAAGQPLEVTWTVTGFVLDPNAFAGAPEAGHGHVHVFVDGTYVTANAGNGVTLTGLGPGAHTIKVQLFNNDHSALATEYSDELIVTVTGTSAPSTVDSMVFYGGLGSLAVVIVVLAALLLRKGRGGGPSKPDTGSGAEKLEEEL